MIQAIWSAIARARSSARCVESASAVTSVAVASTHRRRGVLRQMMEKDLADSVERGECVSVLLASEYPIYGRFGFGPAVEGAEYQVRTEGLRFLRPSLGEVEMVDLATLRKEGPPVFEQFRRSQVGSIERDDAWWDRVLEQVAVPGVEPGKGFRIVYRSPEGEVEGYARYGADREWVGMRPNCTVRVSELVALSPRAYQALWEFLANLDLTTSIVAGDRPTDEVLPYLLADARLVTQARRWDFLWVRILDAPRALSGRRYAVEGRLVLEVVDDAGYAAGRYLLEGGPAGSTCRDGDESADLTLPVTSLGAVYLGAAAFRTLLAAGALDEHSPGAVSRADAMFHEARAPWCTTWF